MNSNLQLSHPEDVVKTVPTASTFIKPPSGKTFPEHIHRARRQRFLDELKSPKRSPLPIRSKWFLEDSLDQFSPTKKPTNINAGSKTPSKESLLALLHCPDSLDILSGSTSLLEPSLKSKSVDQVTHALRGGQSRALLSEPVPLTCESSDAAETSQNRLNSGVELPPIVRQPRRRSREVGRYFADVSALVLPPQRGFTHLAPLPPRQQSKLNSNSSGLAVTRAISPYTPDSPRGLSLLSSAVYNSYFNANSRA
jgi:hypothetical protein